MPADPPLRIAVWRQRIFSARLPVVAVVVVLTLLVLVGDWWAIWSRVPTGTAAGAGLTVAGAAAALMAQRRPGSPWLLSAVVLLGAALLAAPWLTPPVSWSLPWWPLTTAALLGCVLLIDGIGGRWAVVLGGVPIAVAAAGLLLSEPVDGRHPIGSVVAQVAHHAGVVGVCAAVLWAVTSVADLVDRADLPGEAERLAAARGAALCRVRPETARQVHDRVLPVLQMVAMDRADISAQACRGGALALRRESDPGPDIIDLVSAVAAVPTGAVTAQLRGAPALIVPRLVGETLVAAVAEALRNVARHAGVTRAVVEIGSPRPLAAGVRVRVSDAGRGFDPAAVPANRHGVARSIGDRMRSLGGFAEVSSAPGGGTTVTLGWRPPLEPRTGSAPAVLGVAGARRMLAPAAVHPAVNVVAAAATAASMARPAAGIVGAAGLLVAVLALVRWIPRRSLTGAGTVLATVWMASCVAAAGAAVPSGSTDPSLFGTGSSAAAVVAVVWAVRPRWQALLVGSTLTLVVLGVLVWRFAPSTTWWVILVAPLVGAGAGAVLGALVRRAGREVVAAETLSSYRLSGSEGPELRRLVAELDPATPALLDGLADGSIDPAAGWVRREAAAAELRLREGLACLQLPLTRRAVTAARDAGLQVVLHLASDLGGEVDRPLAGFVAEETRRWSRRIGPGRTGVRLTVTARRSGPDWRLSVLGAGPDDVTGQRVLTLECVDDRSANQPTWQGAGGGGG